MTDAPANSAYVDTATYDVALARPVEWPAGTGILHSPMTNPHRMVGKACREISERVADAIASARAL